MKYSKNLQRLASRLVDDKVRESFVEQYASAREIEPAMSAVRNFRQSEKALEKLRDDPVGRFQIFALEQEKPYGVNIQDGVFG